MTDPTTSGKDGAHAATWLLGRIDYERANGMPYRSRGLKLERMRDLLRRLGDPQEQLRVVHVAGTKGKGSTASMVSAILSAAGYRVGLYTSPHLEQLEERLAIDGEPCPPDCLSELAHQVRPVVEAMDREAGDSSRGPTYFEITTAMANLHFADSHVDLAVMEVGLGGRLDSTNVCRPDVTVITSISLDHTKQLGSTLADIAREKAGIIKPGVPVVSGVRQLEPQTVIRQIAEANQSPLFEIGTAFDFEYDAAVSRVRYRSAESPSANPWLDLPLLGRHQAANAAVALTAVDCLVKRGWSVSEVAIRRGLAEARCPARVELVARQPNLILDAAHNDASMDALLDVIQQQFPARPRLLVFATSRDKDVPGMLGQLLPHFDHCLLTRFQDNPRGVELPLMMEQAKQVQARLGSSAILECCRDPRSAWQRICQEGPSLETICVTGSFFLAAEMRRLIGAGLPSAPVADRGFAGSVRDGASPAMPATFSDGPS